MRLPSVRPFPPVEQQPTPEEAPFEEVGLNDEVKPKRRSIFGRFGDASDASSTSTSSAGSHHHGFLFSGRRRGHSGQGAELHPIDRPVSSGGPGIEVGT